MAEIGLVASVVQIADTGIKLSITLYTFAETVLTADKSIREIASDVSLTSSVLEELGQNLKKDQKSRLCSENAVKTAEGIVKECAAIFNEINGTLETTLEKIKPRAGSEKGNGRNGAHGGRKVAVAAMERLKWPFLQPKMQLLRSNLDRLKSTLVLMLNVITYARKVSEDHATPSTLEDQRRLIEDLARSNQEYTRKFKELTKAVEAGQNHLEAVKPISTTENMPSSGFLQANMVLPAFESFHTAGEASPDITSRLTTLTKQHLPPDAEPQSDELSHYCLLINHLLQRIDAVQYKIKSDLRRRIRSDVVHMHQREADQLADAHGHRQFTTVMGSATKWAETLHPTEFGASQTLRNLLHPDWSEQDWNSFDALLEHGDAGVPPDFPPTSTSRMDRREKPSPLAERVDRMIALEKMMRCFAAGEEDTPKRAAGASSRIRPMQGRPAVYRRESFKFALWQQAPSGSHKSEPHTSVSEGKGDGELENEARQLLPRKSNNVENANMLYSGGRPGSPSPHREVDDVTTDAATSKLPLRDSSRSAAPSSRFNTGSKLYEPELQQRKYTLGGEFSYGDTYSPPTSNPLDRERARVKKALDDRRDNSLNMMIFSEAKGSGILLAGDLRILETLTPIRDKIREVASSEQMATRPSPPGSASEIAEDAILTALKFWRSVHLIHENTHGHISPADRDIAVARFADLVLESAPVTVKAWKGLTDVDGKINRTLDGTETGDGAMARAEVLRKASRKFALLTSSQRQALQEAWFPETKYKGNQQKGGRKAQRLSRSIKALSLFKKKVRTNAVPELQSMSTPQQAGYTTVFELPADDGSDLRVQHNAPARTLFAEPTTDVPPHVRNDEQNDEQNELSSRKARFSADFEQLDLENALADWSSTALRRRYSENEKSMESASFSGDIPTNLGSWADESADVAPVRPQPAKELAATDKVFADTMWDSEDDIGNAPHVEEDEITDLGQQSMPLITRPRSPDLVDDLLAEWTTLPR